MDEKEIDNEYGFEEETSGKDDSGVEVDSGATETEEANTSVEDSAVESQEVESNDVDFENNYTTPTDYSWLVNVSDEDTTKKDEYSEGFNPEYYEYAQELVGNESSSFNMSKEKAGEAYDKAQKSLDEAKGQYEKAVERYNKEEAQAKELSERYGIDIVDLGISKPGTLEEFTQKYVDDANKAKEEYSKYENDSKVFQDYLDKYKEDWDKYQSTLSKEDVKEDKNSFIEAYNASIIAERAATMHLIEKYGDNWVDVIPREGWTIENCQKIVDGTSSVPADEKLVELAKDIIEAKSTAEKAKKESEASDLSKREAADAMKKDVFEAYKNGEISAVEYSNLMNKADKMGASIDFSRSEPVKAQENIELPGGTEYGKIVAEFQYLNSIKDKVNSINVNEAKDEAQIKTIQNDLVETQAQLIEQSHAAFTDIVKELVAQGKELKDIRDSDQVKEFSQEVFELAQSIYDKASILEEKAKALGLDEYADVSKWEKVKTTASAAWDAVIHGKSINSDEAYATMNIMQSIEGVKSASLALMKSAAFNGATDVKGGKAAEAMKAEVVSKLSWKDFASTSLWGGLGILATGIGIATGNPLLIAAGIYVNLKKGGEFAGKVTMSNVTKGEQMFGMNDSRIMNPAIQVYNQSQEAANIGDPKSASTYVTATQGALEIISGLMLMIGTGGIGAAVGIPNIKDGIDSLYKLNKGGLDGNTKTLISNIYVLGERVEAWSGMDIPELEKLIQTLVETGPDGADSRVSAEYGTSSADSVSADSKYSGYREQAKDSNLATDYNEGMEKETNEAVSDMNVKVFKVYSKEPDYIRTAIGKILKSFKENY